MGGPEFVIRRHWHFGKTEIARHRSTPFEGDRPSPRKLIPKNRFHSSYRVAYSALACRSIGMSVSASFQRVRKSW